MPGLTVDEELSSITTSPDRIHEESTGSELTSPTTNSTIPQSDVSDSPMVSVDNRDASSELTSPANTSTGIKKKGIDNATSGNRRSSNRVKAKPAFFDASPIVSFLLKSDIPSPSLQSPSLEEKTTEDEQEEDSVDKTVVEEEEESDKEDEVEDEEVMFKKPPPVNRRRSKGTLNITVKKGKTPTGKKKGSTRTPGVAEEEEGDESSLFDIVKGGKSALMSVINDWIESYNEDKVAAMVELIQFFVQCSGCNASVTRAMVDEEDTVRAIRHLTENFGEHAEEYPLIITRPEFKKFKGNFGSFILQLVNLCQHNIVYDEDMMDILICWIIGLSDSQVRAFRHTSTLAGMKIVTGLIDVALKVGIELDNTQRQLDGENQKTSNKRSREKLEKLQKKREELRHNKTELEDMMNRIFSGIFIHRYRDCQPEIRSLCIAEIGLWMDKYNSYFLDQNYLKYLGWTLYDKVGEVRLEVLKGLQKLYDNEDFIERLELFTERFKSRLIHMTLDIDTEVAVQAIKIASLLYKYDVLDEDDCSQVEQLVFCDQRRMAHAAGEFLALRIIRLSIEASPKKMRKGHKEDYLRQMNIKAILDFFIKTEIHEHCTYIVDSLWEHTNLLKDWKTMTKLLLDTNSMIDLEDEEESALIDLMHCACKQAADGTGPPGRMISKKQNQKEKKTHMEDRYSISTHFMENLPSLLEKYKADVPKVRELLKIPQYFDLEVYAEKRLTKQLEALLKHMEDIVLKHADTELLDICSETYHYLVENELVIQQTAEISRNRLIDEIVEKWRKSIAQGIPNEDDDKESQSYFNIVTSLKRIFAFNKNHDLSDWDFHQDINAIINQGITGSTDDEVLILAIKIMYMTLLMSFASLDEENPQKADLKELRKHQKMFVKQCDELLQFSNLMVKTEVFKILCDSFLMFAKQIQNTAPTFALIVCEAEPTLQVRMRDFVITNVFNALYEEEDDLEDEEDDTKAQELYSKRVLLGGLCKLIAYQIFDLKMAAVICAQFLKAYADHSDIIKLLMHKAKECNLFAFSRVLCFALQQAYESLRDDSGGEIDTRSAEFGAIKDLARRFALMLGVNINTNETRKSTITIHREGIKYAFDYPIDSSQTSPSKQVQPEVPPNLLFLEVLHEFTYRVIKQDRKLILTHLESTAGDLLQKKDNAWAPIKTYKNGLDTGSNETKLTDEAERELEEEMIIEKKSKKKPISFANETKTKTVADKSKVKKKLSMSKVGEAGKWLSKKTIEEESEKVPPKVAKAIPKPRKSTGGNENKSVTKSPSEEKKNAWEEENEPETDFQIEESKKSPKTSDKKPVPPSPLDQKNKASPKKHAAKKDVSASPPKGEKVKETEEAKPTIPANKNTPMKKGAVANSPVRLNSGASSAASGRKKRKVDEPSSQEEDESESTQSELDTSQTEDGESTSSQKSWLASQPRQSAKKPRKGYGAKSTSPLKRTRSKLEESSQDSGSGSDINSPSAREMRAAKRFKREIPSDLFNDSQDSQGSQEDLPDVL